MKYLKPVALLVTLLLLGWVFYLPGTRAALIEAAQWAELNPALAVPAFFLTLIVAVVLMFPVWGMFMIGGYLFGLLGGVLVVWAAYQIGAALAFIFARTIGRQWVKKRFSANERFNRFEKAVDQSGFKAILLARFSFVFPTNILNLLAGVSAITLSTFVGATAIGSIPIIFIYTLLGAKSSDLISSIADGTFQAPTFPPVLTVTVIVIVVLLAVLFWARSKRKSNFPN